MTDDPVSRIPPSPEVAVAVRIANRCWRKRLPEAPALLERAAHVALAAAARPAGPVEVSFLLADDARMRRLNRDYRGQDKATNVLAFPAEDGEADNGGRAGPRLLGDVALALETLEREAAVQSKSLNDHLCHLAVHGVLHLLGHDHEEDTQTERMERLETEILAALGIADPYARPPLAGQGAPEAAS